MSLSDFFFFPSRETYAQFVFLAYMTPKRADNRRISKSTLSGFEADRKVAWFQGTGLEHEPFVWC